MGTVVSMVGRVDVDVTSATASTDVVIAVLFELFVVGLSVTTVVRLDTDIVEVNCCDSAVVFCPVSMVV